MQVLGKEIAPGTITAGLLATGAITGSVVPQGGITPDQTGLTVINSTGLSIAAGKLVYVSGWDLTSGLPRVTPAASTSLTTRAQWVTLAAIANGATSVVGKHYQLTGQDTSAAAAVGGQVYLGTNGGYVLPPAGRTILTDTSNVQQLVGRVAVKDASVGVIDFDLISGLLPLPVLRGQATLGQIGTAAGSYYSYLSCPVSGTIISAAAVFPGNLAIDGTNYVQITIVNLIQGGGSTSIVGGALPANSTFTGGAAIVTDQAYALTISATLANLNVSQRDQLKCAVTVVGTLGAVIPAGGVISVGIVPS